MICDRLLSLPLFITFSDNLGVTQPVNKYFTLHVISVFITVFQRTTQIQSKLLCLFFNIHFNIIVPFTPMSCLHLRFPFRLLYAFHCCPLNATCPAYYMLIDLITLIICNKDSQSDLSSFYGFL